MTPQGWLLVLRILMALSLYLFLGAMLYALLRATGTEQQETPVAPQAHLLLLDGEQVGKIVPLDAVNLLGRAESNTILLQDETISAHHARLSYQGTQWWLEDLGSRNGTRLNDVEVSQPLVLTYGDVLELGRLKIRFQAGTGRKDQPIPTKTVPVE